VKLTAKQIEVLTCIASGRRAFAFGFGGAAFWELRTAGLIGLRRERTGSDVCVITAAGRAALASVSR
jgi:hypothetical protein